MEFGAMTKFTLRFQCVAVFVSRSACGDHGTHNKILFKRQKITLQIEITKVRVMETVFLREELVNIELENFCLQLRKRRN